MVLFFDSMMLTFLGVQSTNDEWLFLDVATSDRGCDDREGRGLGLYRERGFLLSCAYFARGEAR
jgi:hypothetical protein